MDPIRVRQKVAKVAVDPYPVIVSVANDQPVTHYTRPYLNQNVA